MFVFLLGATPSSQASELIPCDSALQDWLILAPLPGQHFSSDGIEALVDVLHLPAIERQTTHVKGTDTLQWTRYYAAEYMVDMAEATSMRKGDWALAQTSIDLAEKKTVHIHIGTGVSYILFVNGMKVHESHGVQRYFFPESARVCVRLDSGANHIVMAVRCSPPYCKFMMWADPNGHTPPLPIPWHQLIDIDHLTVPLAQLHNRSWTYKIGDDLVWACPDLDDSDWLAYPENGIAIPDITQDQASRSNQEAFVWFRLHEQISPEEIGVMKLFTLRGGATCEVYVDGIRVRGFGEWTPWFQDFFQRSEVFWYRRSTPVIALRYPYSLSPAQTALKIPPIEVMDYKYFMFKIARHVTLRGHRMTIITIFALFFVIFLTRSLNSTRRKDVFALALTSFCALLAVLSLDISERLADGTLFGMLFWAHYALATTTSLSGFLVFSAGARSGQSKLLFKLFTLAGLVFFVSAWWMNEIGVVFVFLGFAAIEYMRIYFYHIYRKRFGAWLIGIGLCFYVCGLTLNIIRTTPWFPNSELITYAAWYGYGIFLLFVSISFALDDARRASALDALRDDMQDALESEQRRIGRDIHDGLVQQLTGMHFMEQMLAKRLNKLALEAEAQRANEIAALIQDSAFQARRLSHALYPIELESGGIVGCLHALTTFINRSSHVRCSLHCEPQEEAFQDIPNSAGIHLYRIAQEAVNNALKHAAPKHITLTLSQHGAHNTLSINDDGKGFDSSVSADNLQEGGLGIRSMRYRASVIGGALCIGPGSLSGACVTCTWPKSLV